MPFKVNDRIRLIADELPATSGLTGRIDGPPIVNTYYVEFDQLIIHNGISYKYLSIRGSKMELENKSIHAETSSDFKEGDELELLVDWIPGTTLYPAGTRVIFLAYGDSGRNKDRSMVKVLGGTNGSFLFTNRLKYPDELFPVHERPLTRDEIEHLWAVTESVGRLQWHG